MLRTIPLVRVRAVRIPGGAGLWLKLALAAALAFQAARLFWVLITPVGPLGDWGPAMPAAMPAAARSALFASFNPFDRQQVATGATAQTLPDDLKLFGVRDTIGAVEGGAIIGLADGSQVSVSVGETVAPGITLVGVGFDYADVERQGGRQRLFLDADKAPETLGVAAPSAGPSVDAAPAGGPLTVDQFRAAAGFAPRQSGAAVTGVIVSAGADAAALARSGLQAGDVIVAVNGAAISSASDVAQLGNAFGAGRSTSLTVERGGKPVSLTINLSGS